MRQVFWAAAEHLLSPFSSPFFGVKLLYDYGFRAHLPWKKDIVERNPGTEIDPHISFISLLAIVANVYRALREADWQMPTHLNCLLAQCYGSEMSIGSPRENCSRARVCKCWRSPVIDSKKSIPPGCESIPGLLKRFINTDSGIC